MKACGWWQDQLGYVQGQAWVLPRICPRNGRGAVVAIIGQHQHLKISAGQGLAVQVGLGGQGRQSSGQGLGFIFGGHYYHRPAPWLKSGGRPQPGAGLGGSMEAEG